MKKFIIILLLLLGYPLINGDIYAQEGSGGTGSIFRIGAGSRAIALGGAFTALGDDPSVLYYNPAALKLNDAPRILANHIQLFSGFSDATYDFLGLAYPTTSVGAFGIGFMSAGTGGIREFDQFSRETGEISYRENQGILAYAFELPWKYAGAVTTGFSVKILSQRVGESSDTGTGVDLGFLYRHRYLPGVTVGCNFQDLVGAETKLVETSEKVDRTIMLGAGYSYPFQNGSVLNLAVQLDMPARMDKAPRFGAEYDYKHKISFRMGFDSQSITAGIGVGWRGYQADYGFYTREEAGSSHPVSISARIGMPLEEKIRIQEELRIAEEQRRLDEIFSRRVRQHITAADSLRREGLFDQAFDEIKIALEYDPGNETASRMREEVGEEIMRQQEERAVTQEKAVVINEHFRLGLNHYSNNEYILARAQWRNVLELDQENKQAADYLERTEQKLAEQIRQHQANAAAYERNGKLADALVEWNMVKMIDPENAEAAEATGRISRRMEELSRDLRSASRRLGTIELFENALNAFSVGRYNEATELLTRVLGRQPDHQEARNLLRRIQRRMTPLTEEQKEEIRKLYIEGMKQFTQQEYQQAIETWRKILEIDPDNESVKKNIEEAELRIQKLQSPEAD
ncbi:MAG: PorV/PorQ family protein [Candidatus Krumholzibacteriota bacterium]|nr:PorV/PorQ family protein [Candidatus Krumholzibacteriota bacterium]